MSEKQYQTLKVTNKCYELIREIKDWHNTTWLQAIEMMASREQARIAVVRGSCTCGVEDKRTGDHHAVDCGNKIPF